MNTPALSRRAFLRGAATVAVPVAIVAPATPLWARWLRDEMRKLTGRRVWSVPCDARSLGDSFLCFQDGEVKVFELSLDLPMQLNGGDVVTGGVVFDWHKQPTEGIAL